MLNTYSRGDKIPLNLDDSARKRLVCGLRWDPMQDSHVAAGGPARSGMAGAVNAYDLDLICLIYAKDGTFLGGVSGTEGEHIADNGNIYHTGDVTEGEDDHDDEQIILELFNLSSKIHHIVLIAEVQSAHTFGQVENPAIRLANAVSDHDFIACDLGTMQGGNASAYIFGCVSRASGGWAMRYINEYRDLSEIRDWTTELLPYLELDEEALEKIRNIKDIEKGEHIELAYSKEARHRVLCGLSWDPMQDNPEFIERLRSRGRNIESYDLDLACLIYDQNGEIIDGVSANPTENADQSGTIYHSGDSVDGDGDLDDESISVELRNLPDYIHHIVFVSEIQSMHDFTDILNPAIRIADGKTNNDQLAISLSRQEADHYNSYIFARLYRNDNKWMLHYIDEFFVGSEIDDLAGYVKQYLV